MQANLVGLRTKVVLKRVEPASDHHKSLLTKTNIGLINPDYNQYLSVHH